MCLKTWLLTLNYPNFLYHVAKVAVAAAPAVSLVPAPAPAAAAPPPPTAAPAAAPPAPPKPASSNGAPDGLEISSPMSGMMIVARKVLVGHASLTVTLIECLLVETLMHSLTNEKLAVLKALVLQSVLAVLYLEKCEQKYRLPNSIHKQLLIYVLFKKNIVLFHVTYFASLATFYVDSNPCLFHSL